LKGFFSKGAFSKDGFSNDDFSGGVFWKGGVPGDWGALGAADSAV
jgi:hypothetical protein